jgi:hypothetical protein
MASVSYMNSRKKYQRPQAMLWANNPGTNVAGLYIPNGFEVGQNPLLANENDLLNEFIVLSDDNRGPLQFDTLRIEKRERMINGRMRSYHIADKLTLSTSWTRVPSRSFASFPGLDSTEATASLTAGEQYTSDGGAGGAEILDWYNNHQDSFWVYLAYDKYTDFSEEDEQRYSRLNQYNEVIEMFISGFSYSVEKRGGSNFDFWNISVSLEEV